MSSLRNSYYNIAKNKSSADFNMEVAMERVPGVESYSSSGSVQNLLADVETDVSSLPAILLPPNSGESLEILSDNAGDTDIIMIHALGPYLVELEPIIVTLTGNSPLVIPGAISRVNSAYSIGDDGFNGNVIIRTAGGAGNDYLKLEADAQASFQSLYSVPANKKFLVGNVIGTMRKSSGTDTDVVVKVYSKLHTQTKWQLGFAFGLQRSGDTSIEFDNKLPGSIIGPIDVKATAESSAAGASVLVRFTGLLYDESTIGS